MLPTFVIGLREGLEAALIIGIIAAFLRKQGRRDLLRWVFLGVGVAVLLCVGAGVLLDVLSRDLPQRQQEGLETVIGALAVGMVTWMVVWMKRHSRDLKGQLEGLAADAMATRSGAARAMVLMAFLAVLREGIETVVFLLAVFERSTSGAAGPAGAVLGIAVAVALGYGIYRGGVRINLSRFFRATGLVLVLVAAGIVVNTLHTAHEAGWLDVGQQHTVDLTWLVEPGSVQASLLTGMLGVQSRPVVLEVVGWLLYLLPFGLYVAWPPGRGLARRTAARALLAGAGVLAVLTAVLALAAPSRPAARPTTAGGDRVLSTSGDRLTARLDGGTVALQRTGTARRAGLATVAYTGRSSAAAAPGSPAALDVARIAELNGGRLPIGLTPGAGTVPVRYHAVVLRTIWIDPGTARIVDEQRTDRTTVSALTTAGAALPLQRPLAATTSGTSPAAVERAAAAARADAATADRRAVLLLFAWIAGLLAAAALLGGLVLLRAGRRAAVASRGRAPAADLVRT